MPELLSVLWELARPQPFQENISQSCGIGILQDEEKISWRDQGMDKSHGGVNQ